MGLVPFSSSGNPDAIIKKLGPGPIDIFGKNANDLYLVAGNNEFNYSTWFPTGDHDGYWEYMNHKWDVPDDFKPGSCPVVKHVIELPNLGKKYITLYGVIERRPFPSKGDKAVPE